MKAPKDKGSSIPLLKADTYQAVCYTVVDLGTHEETFKGKDIDRRLILITFEIPTERIEIKNEDGTTEDKPRVISWRNTFSMNEKSNLRKMMESWRGKPFSETQAYDFEFKSLLGVNALIQVAHKTSQSSGKEYAYIQSVTKPLKNMETLESENEHLFFEFDKPFLDQDGFHFPDNMPEWIMDTIKESREYEDLSHLSESLDPDENGDPVDQDGDVVENPDDLPF